eukprot:CAMPEP_0194395676 /NCGR_PEP_ID=MMETSP0174-20130528/124556_1 /TAXON_ID=216777 /ORGANISM="Proboscia alata, Strain PI-D3" /LENGTH=84 /DNA_ID=CAMNT_0039191639 /DNA_START=584 /DNA_END=834 /DNA_ORIENTATION=-
MRNPEDFTPLPIKAVELRALNEHRSDQEPDRLVAVEFGECASNAGTDMLCGAGELRESEFQCFECLADPSAVDADAVLYQSELR